MSLLLCAMNSSWNRKAHWPLPDVWVFADQRGDFQIEKRRVCQLNNFCDGSDGVTVPIRILPKTLEDRAPAAEGHKGGPLTSLCQALTLAEAAWLAPHLLRRWLWIQLRIHSGALTKHSMAVLPAGGRGQSTGSEPRTAHEGQASVWLALPPKGLEATPQCTKPQPQGPPDLPVHTRGTDRSPGP